MISESRSRSRSPARGRPPRGRPPRGRGRARRGHQPARVPRVRARQQNVPPTPPNLKGIHDHQWNAIQPDTNPAKWDNFDFNHQHVPQNVRDPIYYFNLFLGDDIIDHIVSETNKFAQQMKRDNPNAARHSFVNLWQPVNKVEMRQFLGLMFLMGIIHKPRIRDYWSTDPMLCTPIFSAIMARDRFQMILKFLHFHDNDNQPSNDDPDRDRLYKLRPLIDHLSRTFETNYRPESEIAIDESLLLWKGRLLFRQYLPLKRARFGIKLYSLCESRSGYTYRFRVYTGAEDPSTQMTNDLPADARQMLSSEKVVVWLLLRLLGQGNRLYIDNYYTSVPLANYLLDKRTYVTGTIRSNRIPEVIKAER